MQYNREWAFALANLGLLSETGWEIYDTLLVSYKKFFTHDGHRKVTTENYLMKLFHHSAGMMIIVPLNYYYPRLYYYHFLSFIC